MAIEYDFDQDPVPPLRPEADTLPKHFLLTARRLGASQIAMRKKRYGIWQEYTWADSLQHVRNFCLGMVQLGLEHGDKVCIVGDNDPEYYWAELAVQSAGGATIGIFTDATPQELAYLIDNSDTKFVVAHDQEQCDKLLDILDEIPSVKKIIYWDEKGLVSYNVPILMSFEAVEALGREHPNGPERYEELVKQGSSEDTAILSYTSGTTSRPKGAMISHANLYYGSQHAHSIMPVDMGDDYVSFSPLAWITEQSLGLATHIINATVVNFPEQPDTVQEDIREIAPVSMLFPSRLWESLVSQVQARMNDSDIINRTLYKIFMPAGFKRAELEEKGQEPGLLLKFLNWLGELAVFAPLRDKLGLTRIRYAYTSGASISPQVIRFFRAINVDLYQLYGSTECQGHTVHYPGDVKAGTVGKPFPTVQVKVDDDGQIMVKSRAVFKGYYKDDDKTEEALEDGWFQTGDAGYFDENGHLIYLDRARDLIELASGERFSPQYIEVRLKYSPYIHDVMAVGGQDMPYVSALMTIDFENVARWAEKRGIQFTTMVDLSQKDVVADLVKEEITAVNQPLQPPAQIRRFVIMPRSFDADEAELTRTRKLRRRFMEQKYGDVLTAIYSGQPSITMTSEVRYRDGRVGQTEAEVYVRTIGDPADLPVVNISETSVMQAMIERARKRKPDSLG